MIRQHEVVDGRCKHCGALKPDPAENTCIERAVPTSGLRPRPPSASQDYDAIGTRLAELRKERDAVLEQPPTMEDLLS